MRILGLLLAVTATSLAEPIVFESQPGWVSGKVDTPIGSVDQRLVIQVAKDQVFPAGFSVSFPEGKAKFEDVRFEAAEARTLKLNGPLSVDLARKGEVTTRFDPELAFDFSGGPAVLRLVTQDSHIEVNGPVRNATALIKNGTGGRVYFSNGDLEGIRGPLQLETGHLILKDQARLPGVTGVFLKGSREHVAYLGLEGEQVSDRLPPGAPVKVSCGSALLMSGGDEKAVSQAIDLLAIDDSAFQLRVSSRNSNAPVTLTIKTMARDPGSLLILGGDRLGESSFIRVTEDQAILNSLKGAGGNFGTTSMSIVPWSRGIGGGHVHEPSGLVTYSRETGFRELRQNEYASLLREAGVSENVCVTAAEPPLEQSKTINALVCDLPEKMRHRIVSLGENTLTLTSGALSATRATTIRAGSITSGNEQPLSFIGTFNLNSRLIGKGGAVFYAGDTSRLTNHANSLTGDWVFTGGRVLVTDDEIIPDSVVIRLHPTAELLLEGSESIAAIGGTGVIRPSVGGRSCVMVGFCAGQANQVVMGPGGALYPGDQTGTPAVGALRFWSADSDDRIGYLKMEEGVLTVDVTAGGNDMVILQSKNKFAQVSGGTLRVNRLAGFRPKVGMQWEIISGTGVASGPGFERIEDSSDGRHRYLAAAVENRWVLTVVAAP